MSSDITAVSNVSRDEAARQFDSQWQAWRTSRTRKLEDRPRLAHHLRTAEFLPATERSDAVVLLAKTELRHRIELNEFPTVEEYASDFPDFRDELIVAFDQMRPCDDYLLLTRLGSGGMGEVYLAQHLVLGSHVALKILKGERMHDESSIARFRQEVVSIGRLDHQHIVRARDAREIRGHQLLVMDYVDGCDLTAVVRKFGALPVPVACEVIRQAAEGLSHAHRLRIVHRDIKPSNIILSRQGCVKLLDFGLAKLKQEDGADDRSGLTRPGFMGTLDYMAPEQFEDASRVDATADIYSLGCTLYHLLAEYAPFANTGSTSLLSKHRAHAEAPIPSIRSQLPDCPPELDELIASMMAKQPGDRPASALAVALALESLASESDLQAFVETKLLNHECAETLPPTAPQTQRANRGDTKANTARPVSAEGRRRLSRRTVMLGCFGTVAAGCATYLAGRNWGTPHIVARQELVPLPSLSGGWWFREMPWLTPGVRAHLAMAAERGEDEIDGVSLDDLIVSVRSGANVDETREKLLQVAKALVTSEERTAFENLYNADRQDLEISESRGMLKAAARTMSADSASPTEMHLQAAICHELADWERARAAYERALELYAPSSHPRELMLLASSDYALMLSELGDRRCAAAARTAIEQVSADSQCASVWVEANAAHCLVASGDLIAAHVQAMAADKSAQKLLPSQHPLSAFALETLGWSEMDVMKMDDARTSFAKALGRRRRDTKNAHAKHYELHDRQARAMCQYFLGEPDAVRQFSALIDEFRAILKSETLTKRARAELEARFPNTCERFGDCLLFGHFRDADAAEQYLEATRAAEKSGVHLGRVATVTVRARYKRVAALELAGQSQEAEQLFSQATVLESVTTEGARIERVLRPQEIVEVRLYRAVASALLSSHDYEGGPRKVEPLLGLLEKRGPLLETPGKVNRDELGLLLVAARAAFEAARSFSQLETAINHLLAIETETARVSGEETLGSIRLFFTPFWKTALDALDKLPESDRAPQFADLRQTVSQKSRY